MSSQHFPNKVKQTTDFLNTKRPGVSVLSELDGELNHTIMGPESHLVQLFTWLFNLLYSIPTKYPLGYGLVNLFTFRVSYLEWADWKVYYMLSWNLLQAASTHWFSLSPLGSPRNLICSPHDSYFYVSPMILDIPHAHAIINLILFLSTHCK